MHPGIDRVEVIGVRNGERGIAELAANAGDETTLRDVEGDVADHGHERSAWERCRHSAGGWRSEEHRAVRSGTGSTGAVSVDDAGDRQVLVWATNRLPDARDGCPEAGCQRGSEALGGRTSAWSSAPSVRAANPPTMERDRAR